MQCPNANIKWRMTFHMFIGNSPKLASSSLLLHVGKPRKSKVGHWSERPREYVSKASTPPHSGPSQEVMVRLEKPWKGEKILKCIETDYRRLQRHSSPERHSMEWCTLKTNGSPTEINLKMLKRRLIDIEIAEYAGTYPHQTQIQGVPATVCLNILVYHLFDFILYSVYNFFVLIIFNVLIILDRYLLVRRAEYQTDPHNWFLGQYIQVFVNKSIKNRLVWPESVTFTPPISRMFARAAQWDIFSRQ